MGHTLASSLVDRVRSLRLHGLEAAEAERHAFTELLSRGAVEASTLYEDYLEASRIRYRGCTR